MNLENQQPRLKRSGYQPLRSNKKALENQRMQFSKTLNPRLFFLYVRQSFNSHRLCKIAWLVRIDSTKNRAVVSKKLGWNYCKQARKR